MQEHVPPCPFWNLRKTLPKLWPWECRIERVQNGHHHVIKFKCLQSEKNDLANICLMNCGKFDKNRPIRLGCRDDTQRQADIHTDTLDRLQHIQSEYKERTCSSLKRTFEMTTGESGGRASVQATVSDQRPRVRV